MKTYFCPRCGKALESRDCRMRGRRLECSDCAGTAVQVSGAALVTAGLLTALLSGLVLCTAIPTIGAALGSALCAVGVMRLVTQARAMKKRPAEQGTDERAGRRGSRG